MGTPPRAGEPRPLAGSRRHKGRGGLVPVPSGRGDRKGPAAQHNGPGGRSGCSPSWPALQDTTVQVSSATGARGPREREEDEDFPARMSPAPCSSPGWEEGRRHRLRFPHGPSLPKQAAARPRQAQRRARTQLADTHRSPGADPTAPTQPPAGRAPRARRHKRPRAGPCSLLSRSGNFNSFKMSGSVGASERAALRARAGLRTSRKAARTARAGGSQPLQLPPWSGCEGEGATLGTAALVRHRAAGN